MTYRPPYILAIGVVVAGLVLLVALVLLPGNGVAPIDLAKVTRVADAQFNAAYDWHCAIAYPPQRVVVCDSQPNDLYRLDYQVTSDGTPVLVASIPPPKN